MSQQALSPLVQVMQQPSAVISHLHMPIIMLQVQTVMPFIVQQIEHMPPAIMVQRFCIMAQAVGSSQVQVIFMPPAHFSIFMVQRGTMTILGAIGFIGMVPGIPMFPVEVVIPVEVIGFIIAVTIVQSSICRWCWVRSSFDNGDDNPACGVCNRDRLGGCFVRLGTYGDSLD